MERILTAMSTPPAIGRLSTEQVAQRSTWKRVPDSQLVAASMHRIDVVPVNGSTRTTVNRLDPGTVQDHSQQGEPHEADWYETPRTDPRLNRSR